MIAKLSFKNYKAFLEGSLEFKRKHPTPILAV